MEDKELQKQIESIIRIEIDSNEEKTIETIEDEIKEILNLGDEE